MQAAGRGQTRTHRCSRSSMHMTPSFQVTQLLGCSKTWTYWLSATQRVGIVVNVNETEVLAQASPAQTSTTPTYSVAGSNLNNVQQFTYLGSMLTDDCDITSEVITVSNCHQPPLGDIHSHNLNMSTSLPCHLPFNSPLLQWQLDTVLSSCKISGGPAHEMSPKYQYSWSQLVSYLTQISCEELTQNTLNTGLCRGNSAVSAL